MNSARNEKTIRGKKIPLGRLLQIVLAIGGAGLFALLASKVDFSSIPERSAESLPLFIFTVLGLLLLNYLADTASWWILCRKQGPTLWQLVLIRLRCEAITNLVPGGAMIGEPMKISFYRDYSGASRAEAATSFLLGKFSLIVGQTFYVFVGLALAYGVIDSVSEGVFGVANFAAFVLLGALTIFIFIIGLAAAMVWFQPMNRRLRRTSRRGKLWRWWNLAVVELHNVEKLVATEFRHHRFRLIPALLFSFAAWSLNGIELYVIFRWLGVDLAFHEGYAIDAVSTVVRMVVFVIPIGMGGQDWTIAGLVAAYGVGDARSIAANAVVMKRAREFFVIGIGLLLLFFMRRPAPPASRPLSTENGAGIDLAVGSSFEALTPSGSE